MALKVIAIAMALAVAVPAAAQDISGKATEQDYILTSAWSNDCTHRNAEAVDLSRLVTHPESYRGRCVSVDGYWKFRALFPNASDAQALYSNANSRSERRRIGLYMREADQKRFSGSDALWTHAVGRVEDCSSLNGPHVLMIFGYCHYTEGPILLVGEIHALE